MGLIWHQNLELNWPSSGSESNLGKGWIEKWWGCFEIWKGQNSPWKFGSLINGPLKKSRFGSVKGHFSAISSCFLHVPVLVQIYKSRYIISKIAFIEFISFTCKGNNLCNLTIPCWMRIFELLDSIYVHWGFHQFYKF